MPVMIEIKDTPTVPVWKGMCPCCVPTLLYAHEVIWDVEGGQLVCLEEAVRLVTRRMADLQRAKTLENYGVAKPSPSRFMTDVQIQETGALHAPQCIECKYCICDAIID